MARSGRTFTIDVDVLQQFDELVAESPGGARLQALYEVVPPKVKRAGSTLLKPSTLDMHDLSKHDYAFFDASLAVPKIEPKNTATTTGRWAAKFTEYTDKASRVADWDSLVRVLHGKQSDLVHKTIMTEVKTRQIMNRRLARKYRTMQARVDQSSLMLQGPRSVSASYVIDALLVLGMTVLKERAATRHKANQLERLGAVPRKTTSEPSGSPEGHDGQVEAKCADRKGRRAA